MANKLGPLHKKAWITFFLAYDKITKEIDRRMQDEGVVSLATYDILLILEVSEGRKMKMSDLATQTSFSMSGATRAVDKLEKEGLIERVACSEDRRAVYAQLTDKGLSERQRAWPVYETGIQELFAEKMGLHEAETLVKVFERISPVPAYF